MLFAQFNLPNVLSDMPGAILFVLVVIGIGLGLLLLLGVAQMYFMTGGGRTLSYSEFKALVRSGEVVDVTIGDQALRGTLKGADPKDPKQGQAFTVNRVEDPKLVEDLEEVPD